MEMKLLRENINGLIINGYEDEYIFETIRKQGFYEIEVLQKWLSPLNSCKVLFDVGANIGNHTMFWAKNIFDAEIYAFEPYPANYNCLEKNIADNNLGDSIHAVRKALGNEKKFAETIVVDSTNLGATTFRATNEKTDTEITTIDDYVNENNLNSVDFIKIDTEGFELAILEGMAETIGKYKPIIWVEVSYDSYKDVNRCLVNYNYKLVDYSGFNMFYIPDSNNDIIYKDFREERFFDDALKYLEKTNLYYKNYNVTKEKLTEANEKYRTVTEQYKALNEKQAETAQKLTEANEKYRTVTEQYKTLNEKQVETAQKLTEANEKYRTVTEQYKALNEKQAETAQKLTEANEKYRTVTEQYKTLNEKQVETEQIKNKFAEELMIYIQNSQNEIETLQDCNRLVSSQQTQINCLKQENEQYRKKLSIITDSWYGKILIACYRRLKRVRNLFRKTKKKGGK